MSRRINLKKTWHHSIMGALQDRPSGAMIAFNATLLTVAVAVLVGCTASTMESSVAMPYDPTPRAAQDAKLVAYMRKHSEGIAYALPMGKVKVAAERKEQNGDIAIVISAKYVADPNYPMVVRTRPSGTAADEFTVEVDPSSGLLKEVKSVNDDKTAEIMKAVTDVGVQAFRLSQGLGFEAKIEPFRVDVEFNPFDQEELSNAKSVLSKIAGLTLKFDAVSSSSLRRSLNRKWSNEINYYDQRVYYRMNFPYAVTVSAGGGASSNYAATATVMLPNESPTFNIDVRRASFVKTETTVTFSNGVISKIHSSKPSEVLGAAQAPLEILKSLAHIRPSKLRMDKAAQDKALADAEKQKIIAETALMQEQQKKLQAENDLREKKKQFEGLDALVNPDPVGGPDTGVLPGLTNPGPP